MLIEEELPKHWEDALFFWTTGSSKYFVLFDLGRAILA